MEQDFETKMKAELDRQKSLRLDEIDAHNATRQQLQGSSELNGLIAAELDILIDVEGGKQYMADEVLKFVKSMKAALSQKSASAKKSKFDNIRAEILKSRE